MVLKPICALLSAALLSMAPAQAETYKWDSFAMGGGGFVTGVIPSPSERGMIFYSTDGGVNWVQSPVINGTYGNLAMSNDGQVLLATRHA